MHVREIRKERNNGNTFNVYYTNTVGDFANKEVYAKDELEAYTRFHEIYEEGAKKMRVVFLCITVVLLAVLSSITYSCTDSRSRYMDNMATCVKAGKSYISEGGGYSCRDPFVKVTQ